MAFDKVIGQKKVKKILRNMIDQDRVHHALLFYGDPGVGKEAMALEMAKAFFCSDPAAVGCDHCQDCRRISKISHPDLVYIFPAPGTIKTEEEQQIFQSLTENPYRRQQLWSNPTISIERIRALKRKVALKSFEGRGRVVIIVEAHKMTQEAANSLLKILEEPPEKMCFILETAHVNQLLPTIISRCQAIGFATLSQQDIEKALIEREQIEVARAQVISRIAFGNYRRALELIEEDLSPQRKLAIDLLRGVLQNDYQRLVLAENLVREKDKLQIKELLGLMLFWFRDAFIYYQFGQDSKMPGEQVVEKLVNVDELATLERFVRAFEQIQFEPILFELENAIELINRNVNVTLILIVLFENLRKYLGKRKNV